MSGIGRWGLMWGRSSRTVVARGPQRAAPILPVVPRPPPLAVLLAARVHCPRKDVPHRVRATRPVAPVECSYRDENEETDHSQDHQQRKDGTGDEQGRKQDIAGRAHLTGGGT